MEFSELKEAILSECADRFQSQERMDAFCNTVLDNILNVNGYINLDFHDVMNTINNAEIVEIASQTGHPDTMQQMLEQMHADMSAKHPGMNTSTLLLQIQFDRNGGMTIDKLDGVTRFMSGINEETDVIWGTGFDDTLGTDIRITLIEGLKR